METVRLPRPRRVEAIIPEQQLTESTTVLREAFKGCQGNEAVKLRRALVDFFRIDRPVGTATTADEPDITPLVCAIQSRIMENGGTFPKKITGAPDDIIIERNIYDRRPPTNQTRHLLEIFAEGHMEYELMYSQKQTGHQPGYYLVYIPTLRKAILLNNKAKSSAYIVHGINPNQVDSLPHHTRNQWRYMQSTGHVTIVQQISAHQWKKDIKSGLAASNPDRQFAADAIPAEESFTPAPIDAMTIKQIFNTYSVAWDKLNRILSEAVAEIDATADPAQPTATAQWHLGPNGILNLFYSSEAVSKLLERHPEIQERRKDNKLWISAYQIHQLLSDQLEITLYQTRDRIGQCLPRAVEQLKSTIGEAVDNFDDNDWISETKSTRGRSQVFKRPLADILVKLIRAEYLAIERVPSGYYTKQQLEDTLRSSDLKFGREKFETAFQKVVRKIPPRRFKSQDNVIREYFGSRFFIAMKLELQKQTLT